jgi:hypothetical protein
MGFGSWDEDLLASVRAMLPLIEGKACVNIDTHDRSVYVCRRIGDLVVDEDSVEGTCDWVDPEHARPGELTDGLAISCECLQIGPGWWLDTYFHWYFVFDPDLINRSLAGDHSWVGPFLDRVERPAAEPGTAADSGGT